MKFSDFETLTFDVVGTLIDFETGILDWFQPALKRYGVSKTDEEVLATFAVVEDKYQKESPEKPSPRCFLSSTAIWHPDGASSFARRMRRASGTLYGLGLLSPIRWRRLRSSEPGIGSWP